MDENPPYNNGGTISPLILKGHGKFMGYFIIVSFNSLKEPHILVTYEDVSKIGCCWIIFYYVDSLLLKPPSMFSIVAPLSLFQSIFSELSISGNLGASKQR